MENSLLKTAVGTAAVVALLTLPPMAVAETVVPPGNSAATQYTETFPTTGGNAEVNNSINGGVGGRGGSGHSGGGGGRSPEKVLGSSTAHQLETHGQEGRTVAQLATDAAPASAGQNHTAAGKPSGGGGGNGSGNGGSGQGGANGGGQKSTGPTLDSQASGGSSGFSEVLSHATGSGGGELGIVLPLVLIVTPLVALAYAWRRRHQDQLAP